MCRAAMPAVKGTGVIISESTTEEALKSSFGRQRVHVNPKRLARLGHDTRLPRKTVFTRARPLRRILPVRRATESGAQLTAEHFVERPRRRSRIRRGERAPCVAGVPSRVVSVYGLF